jgi:membrane protein
VTSAGRPGAETAARGEGNESPFAVAADYARRLWHKGAEDDVFFLAGGVAFSILLAGVPFFLLLASGLGYVLNKSEDASSSAVADFLQQLFPATFSGEGSLLDPVLHDVVRTRGAAGILGAIAFVWFSTRLFGSMRSVLLRVFDEPRGRGIVMGKLFDLQATIVSIVLIVSWITVTAYLALARTGGVEVLSEWGLHAEDVMRDVVYELGRAVAFVLLGASFFATYKLLPTRAVRWQQAAVGALTAAVLFEIARSAFTWIVHRFDPGSLYTGTLSAVIVVVFWVYYAALIFVLSGEVAQIHELRRLERDQVPA